ncbi:hypothetical protein EV363DRAFT_559802 [Boletus edulis]|nr:hypothetical protein EV363DRAFT_559802 [Boletus edulis]
MDPPHRPPNLFNDDSDSSQVYVPSNVDKGKRKSEAPLDMDEVDPRYRTSYHVHSQIQDDSSSDSDTLSDFGSELTPSPPSVGDVVCNPAGTSQICVIKSCLDLVRTRGNHHLSEKDSEDREGDKLDIIDQDESDRMFTFEVAQTNEQEESVAVREGFEAVSQVIARPEVHTDDPDSTKPAPIAPFLVHGETAQGYMMVEHQQAKLVRDMFRGRTIEGLQLEGLLASDRVRLNEKLDDEALKILVRWGLEK